jgi:hypothetical protein
MNSLNATWIRLIKNNLKYYPYLLMNNTVFRLGNGSNFICRFNINECEENR